MGWLTLILEALRAIPKIIQLVQTLMEAQRKAQEQRLIDETQKAVKDGDTRTIEENIGSPRAGAPSDLDGVVRRPSKEG